MRDIRRADPVQDLGRKAGAVVADRDTDLVRRPLREDFDPLMREIHRVLDQIAETIADRRVACADRFRRAVGWIGHADLNAEIAVRRRRFFDQGGKRHAVERFAGRQFRYLSQNLAAALRLLAQQLYVLGMRGIDLERALDLAYHDRDGGKWRA